MARKKPFFTEDGRLAIPLNDFKERVLFLDEEEVKEVKKILIEDVGTTRARERRFVVQPSTPYSFNLDL